MSEMGLCHVHWTILNHNLKLTVVFLGLYFRNSLEKPQSIKERDKGEFGVHLCVPGYINPPAHCRSTGLNGENGERVLHSMPEGGGCTKEKGFSEEHKRVCSRVSEEHKVVIPGVPEEHKVVIPGVPEEHKVEVPGVSKENKEACTGVPDAHKGGYPGVPGEHIAISLRVPGKEEDFKLNLSGSETGLDSKVVFEPGGTDDKLKVQEDKGYYEPGTKSNKKKEVVGLHRLNSAAQKNL